MNPIYRGILPPKNKTVFWMKGKKLLVYTPTGWKETSADITIDDSMVEGSENPVESKVIQQSLNAKQQALSLAISQKQNTLTIDTALSETSENPIENSAVHKQYMNEDDIVDIISVLDPSYIDALMLRTPLTIEATIAGSVTWVSTASVQYRKNDGEWTTIVQNSAIPLEVGDKLQFKGNLPGHSSNPFSNTSSLRYKIYGNMMSLLNDSSFENLTVLPSSNCFRDFFYANKAIVNSENLKLPAMTLTESCYSGLFKRCSNMVKAPKELPAITAARFCYDAMFQECSALTTAPEIKLTTVVYYCCRDMFESCTSLEETPVLYALSTDTMTYATMFSGCTSLRKATVLVKNVGSYSLYGMFTGVGNTGTLYKNSQLASWPTGTGLPNTWTITDAS